MRVSENRYAVLCEAKPRSQFVLKRLRDSNQCVFFRIQNHMILSSREAAQFGQQFWG